MPFLDDPSRAKPACDARDSVRMNKIERIRAYASRGHSAQ